MTGLDEDLLARSGMQWKSAEKKHILQRHKEIAKTEICVHASTDINSVL